jgi:hypothetical protein
VDSNKLQPIIRYHQDKDFKIPYIEIHKMNYPKIFKGEEPKPKKKQLAHNTKSDDESMSLLH